MALTHCTRWETVPRLLYRFVGREFIYYQEWSPFNLPGMAAFDSSARWYRARTDDELPERCTTEDARADYHAVHVPRARAKLPSAFTYTDLLNALVRIPICLRRDRPL